MEIKLYSTGCDKCKVLKKKLDDNGLEYVLIEDPIELAEAAAKYNTSFVPFMVIDDRYHSFIESVNFINNL